MATIFPSSPTIGDTYQGYEWNGTAWIIIGVDLTTDYVTQLEFDGLINSAPESLNTLNELAAALGDDANFATTVATSIGGKVSKSGDTITGELVVNSNSTSPALRVTQTGSGDALRVEDSANPDATPFVVNATGNVLTSGKVLIGESSSYAVNATGRLQVTGTTDAHISLGRFTANNAGGTINFGKSRGSGPSSHSVVSNGDGLGDLTWNGDDGTNFVKAARITANVDSTPGTNDMPGRLAFWTTADGSATPTERMRITSAGNVGIGTSNPSWPLDVQATAATQGIKIRGRASDNISVFSFNNNANTLTQAAFSCTENYISILVPTTERMRINNAGLITGSGTSLGAWTAYTPTLSGTGWALGNGTAAGQYCQIGKVVHFTVLVTFGSTSTFGASSPSFSVPVTSSTRAIYLSHGDCNDVSAGTFYANQVRRASTTTVQVRALNASQQYGVLSSTFPFTWTTGDIIRVQGTYEAA